MRNSHRKIRHCGFSLVNFYVFLILLIDQKHLQNKPSNKIHKGKFTYQNKYRKTQQLRKVS